MKLVTTFAALELLGRDYRWKTDGVPRRPARRTACCTATSCSRATATRRSPSSSGRRSWRRCARKGLDAIDGDLVLDRIVLRADRRTIPAAFDGEPLQALQRRTRRAARQFQVGAASASRRMPPATRRARRRARRCPNVALGAAPRLVARRAATTGAPRRGAVVRRPRRSRRRRASRDAIRPPAASATGGCRCSTIPHYVHGDVRPRISASAGGRFDGGWKEGRAPRGRGAVRDARVAAALRHRARRQQAVEQRDGAADLPDARHDGEPAAGDAGAGAPRPCGAGSPRRSSTMPELVLDNGSGLSRRERITAGSLARCCSPPTRAACATSSRARSRSRRSTAPCSAASRTAASPDRRCSRPARSRACARIAGYVIDGDGPALRRSSRSSTIRPPARAQARARLPRAVGLRNGGSFDPALRR